MNILGNPSLREGGILVAQREINLCSCALGGKALARRCHAQDDEGGALRIGKLGQRGVLQVC
jgi:hypothetical protein